MEDEYNLEHQFTKNTKYLCMKEKHFWEKILTFLTIAVTTTHTLYTRISIDSSESASTLK